MDWIVGHWSLGVRIGSLGHLGSHEDLSSYIGFDYSISIRELYVVVTDAWKGFCLFRCERQT